MLDLKKIIDDYAATRLREQFGDTSQINTKDLDALHGISESGATLKLPSKLTSKDVEHLARAGAPERRGG